MLPISTRQVDNVDTLPPGSQAGEVAPWQPIGRARMGWAEIVAAGGVALLFLLIGWWLIGADVRYWISYSWGGLVVKVLAGLALLAVVLAMLRRAVLVDQRGYQVPIWEVARVLPHLIEVDNTFAGTPGRMVRAQTISYPSKVEQIAAPQAEPPQLIEVGPAAVPDRQWLDWIDRTPHLMIAGRTEAGKTTMAEAVIAQRASQGELLYVLDPHYQPGKWCGLPAIGGGRGYGDVMQALGLVLDEMDARYKDFNAGKRTEDFDRLTVFIDEVPALVEWCFDGKKLRDQRWMSFAKQLGSEARKVRISVILMTQSPLVQDIQINTRMRENFTRIALGDQSIELIKECAEPRRSQLGKLIEGARYTAVMEYLNQVHVLDTSNVRSLAARHVAHVARPWQPAQIAQQQPARPVVSAYQQAKVERASVADPTLQQLLTTPAPDMLASYRKIRFDDDKARIAWLAYHTKLGTREIRDLVGCNYNYVVAVAGQIRAKKRQQASAG